MSEELTATNGDVIICVHGTFAADPSLSNSGHRWWQHGSSASTWMIENLPGETNASGENIVPFHWSGKNSFAERLKASNRLLALLLHLEKAGRGYHLVGHSHGGSVIWEAIVTAHLMHENRRVYKSVVPYLVSSRIVPKIIRTRRGTFTIQPGSGVSSVSGGVFHHIADHISLPHLRSWTTVATPFLTFLPDGRFPTLPWHHKDYSISPHEANRRWVKVVTSGISILSFLGSFATLVACFARSRIDDRPLLEGGARVYAVAILVVLLILLVVSLSLAANLRFADALSERERAKVSAARTFGSRWLGLWADTDEAILALQQTSGRRARQYRWLVLNRRNRETVQPSEVDRLEVPIPVKISLPPQLVDMVPTASTWTWRLLKLPLFAIFNRLISDPLRRVVSGIIVRSAQGSDVRGATLAFVSPLLVPIDATVSGLPAAVSARLENRAQGQIGSISPELRRAIIQASVNETGLSSIAFRELRGFEVPLVHTSYFEDDDVLAIICSQISRHWTGVGVEETGESHLDQWCIEHAKVTADLLDSVVTP